VDSEGDETSVSEFKRMMIKMLKELKHLSLNLRGHTNTSQCILREYGQKA
jgi:hypothetical protein